MICLGFNTNKKDACVTKYVTDQRISKVFLISPDKFRPTLSTIYDYIEYDQVIQYKFFYRLLQEIDKSTLIVINECLRTQKRGDLTYNCMRHFLNQTEHQIIFQYLPTIDSLENFMILLDFDTQSRWKRHTFNKTLLADTQLFVHPVNPVFKAISVKVEDRVHDAYNKEKRKLIDNIKLKDPHTIPRNLYLMAGKAKHKCVDPKCQYVGRNNRFGLTNMLSYKEPSYPPHMYTIFEFCHNFIDFTDFLALTKQEHFDVLVSDLKVDLWYFKRYQEWGKRLADAYTAIQQ